MAPAADAKTNLVPAAETAVSTGKRRRSNYSSAATKPFKCDYCDHSFNQRIHLKKHLSKHTGTIPAPVPVQLHATTASNDVSHELYPPLLTEAMTV